MRAFVFWCVLALCANVAFGEGDYQRTKDGKTIVWNAEFKAGDMAVWSGNRDAEGYATGAGTLVWYQPDGRVYGRYFGNMVKGRFDGAVNVHSNGKTAHAIFINGKRASIWARGPASSRPAPNEPIVLKAEPAEENRGQRSEDSGQKAQDSEQKKEASRVHVRDAGVTASQGERQTEVPALKAAHQKSDSAVEIKTEQSTPTAQSTIAEVPAPADREQKLTTANPSLGDESTQPSTHSEGLREQTLNAQSSPLEIPPAGPTPEQIVQQPLTGAGTPAERQAVNSNAAPSARSAKAKMDESLGVLVRPPSALHINSIPEPSPAASPSRAKVEVTPTPNAGAHLTQEEAIALADGEARNQGCDLDEFRRPKADYSAAEHKWLLFYDQKAQGGMPEIGKYFTMTVDDATKKAEIKKKD